MIKGAEIYVGPEKRLYSTGDANVLIYEFLGGAAPYDGEEIPAVPTKPVRNAKIAAAVFSLLESKGVPTHFLRSAGETAMEIRAMKGFPMTIACRNIAAGGFAKRLGMPEGEVLPVPVVEFRLDKKPDRKRYPAGLFTEITDGDVKMIQTKSVVVAKTLFAFFGAHGLSLADFSLEFGRDAEGWTRVCGAITPDTCRLWHKDVHEKIDRDRFRRTLRGTEADYIDVLHRITSKV